MTQKLIAIDLDGTTLNNQSMISTKTQSVLTQLQKMGHIVSIATGRPFRTSRQYYEQLNLTSPIVNFNGALCHNPGQNDWNETYHRKLSRDLALDISALKQEAGILLVAAETKEHVYVNDSFVPYRDFFANGHKDTKALTASNLKEDPTAVLVFTGSKETQPLIQEKIIREYGDSVEIRSWGGDAPCLEIVAAGVQKALGVEQIAHHYGIQQKNILAFGDEDNDYEMIQYAGHGVVMKNGIDELKAVANDITYKENHEDGMADYLERYFSLV